MTTKEWYRLMRDKLQEYEKVMEYRWDADEQHEEEFLDIEFIEWWGYDVTE